MKLHDITAGKRNRKPMRVGRGNSSGKGTRCGRGNKGVGQRSGKKQNPRFIGGALPFFRRIPKRGFNNNRFRKEFKLINLTRLEEQFEDGQVVQPDTLVEKGLMRDTDMPVKILGGGELSKNLTVKAHAFTKSALEAIKNAGGQTEELS